MVSRTFTRLTRRDWLMIGIAAAVYFCVGKLGLRLAYVHPSATAVWPPTGITLAAFLFLGPRIWPGIFLGAFLVNWTTAGSLATSMGIAVGNTLEGFLGAFLVSRFAGGARAFHKPQDIFKFTFYAGMLSTSVSATFGVTSLALGGFAEWSRYGTIWFTWWLGDMVSDLVVAPALIIWKPKFYFRLRSKRIFELLFLCAGIFLISQAVFGGWFYKNKNLPLQFLLVPPLLWAACRFGLRGASAAMLVVSGIAIWGTMRGFGPFTMADPNQSLLLLQIFICTLVLAALVLASAVEENRRTQEDMRAISLRKSAILDASLDCIISADSQGRIIDFNPAAEKTFRYSSKEVIGKELAEVIIPLSLRQAHRRGLELFLKTGQGPVIGKRMEMTGMRSDGSEFPVELAINVVYRDHRPFFTAYLRDVSERKTAEQALVIANKRLSQLVAVKDEFVASVSHELRTPLTAIKEGIALVLDRVVGPITAEQEDFLRIVDDSVDRLTELINNLLDISKIEAGKFGLSRQRVRIQELIETLLSNYRLIIGRRTIKKVVARDVPDVYADSARMLQVLSNLFSNAVKFTRDEGTIVITVNKGENEVIVSVEDDGIGIAPDDLPKLFKKFSQVGAQQAQGTGLGLALVKQLVELHKGSVDVSSELGKGSKFTFTVPAYLPSVLAQSSSA